MACSWDTGNGDEVDQDDQQRLSRLIRNFAI